MGGVQRRLMRGPTVPTERNALFPFQGGFHQRIGLSEALHSIAPIGKPSQEDTRGTNFSAYDRAMRFLIMTPIAGHTAINPQTANLTRTTFANCYPCLPEVMVNR